MFYGMKQNLEIKNNIIGSNCYGLYFDFAVLDPIGDPYYISCINNNIGSGCCRGVIRHVFENSTIKENCSEFTLYQCVDTHIGCGCVNFGITSDQNELPNYIGNNCSDINISGYGITIGNNCKSIELNGTRIENVIIGNNCWNIRTKDVTTGEIISDYFLNDVYFGDGCNNIILQENDTRNVDIYRVVFTPWCGNITIVPVNNDVTLKNSYIYNSYSDTITIGADISGQTYK